MERMDFTLTWKLKNTSGFPFMFEFYKRKKLDENRKIEK